MNTTPLTNPYLDCLPGKPGGIRLNVNVLKSDVDRIRIVNLEPGFLTYALAGFVKHLATICKQNDWSLAQSEQLTAYVRSIIDANTDRSTSSLRSGDETAAERPHKNDRRRTRGVGQPPKVDPHQHAVGSGDETETEGNKDAA